MLDILPLSKPRSDIPVATLDIYQFQFIIHDICLFGTKVPPCLDFGRDRELKQVTKQHLYQSI